MAASLLARVVGPTGVGEWAMINAITGFLYSFLLYWTQPAAVRFGTEEWIVDRKLSQTWASRRFFVIIGLVIAFFLLAFNPFSFQERYYSLSHKMWFLTAVYLLGKFLLSEVQTLYRSTGKMIHFGSIAIIIDAMSVIFLLWLFFDPFLVESKNQITFIGMIMILTGISAVFWFFEYRTSRSAGGRSSSADRFKIIKFSLPLLPGIGVAYLSNWAPSLILLHFKSSADVGLFNVGFQIMAALTGLAASISVIFLPKIINNKLSNTRAEADYVKEVCPTVAILWLIAIIPVLAFVPLIFTIFFGEKFKDAIPLLIVLCAAVPGAVFPALYSTLFNIQGRFGRSSVFTALMAVLSALVTLLFVKKYAGLAVAIGTLLSCLMTQILYISDQHDFLKVPKKKILILYIFSTMYGFIQWIIGEHLIPRLTGAFLAIFLLFFLTRHLSLINKDVFTRIFSGKLARVGSFLYNFLIQD